MGRCAPTHRRTHPPGQGLPTGLTLPTLLIRCVVEDSQHFSDLLAPIRALDYATIDHETLQHSAFPTLPHPIDLAEERGVRLLTTDFRAGDLVRSQSAFCQSYSKLGCSTEH